MTDFSQEVGRIVDAVLEATSFMSATHVLMRPRLFPDGNQWCALYGEDLQEGVAGFGDTPEKACADFDRNWSGQRLQGAGKTRVVTREPEPCNSVTTDDIRQ